MLLEEISGPATAGRVSKVARAVAELHIDASTIVVVSPHGDARGIHRFVRGDLDGFGRSGVSIDVASDRDIATALGTEWDAPLLDTPVDHGIVTPLALGLGTGAEVVAVCVQDAKDGIAMADALDPVTARTEKRVMLVCSAHLCAALTPRAPVPLRDETVALEDELLAGITRDVAILVERAEDITTVGVSCGGGPLAAFGQIFSGHAAEVVAYDRTCGVGYLIARVGD